jgi:PKD repeat protein
MKAFNFYILLFFLGICLSCAKKKYPDPLVIENAAVFYSKLTINNSPVLLEAGVNGYYMYSSYIQDSVSLVYGFIADLRQSNCSNCTNRLKIQINDYKISFLNEPALIDSSLHPAKYSYLAGDPVPSYSVKFNPFSSSDSYRWDFGDGTFSVVQNPVKLFSRSGIYNICLTTQDASGCVSSICNKEKIDLSNKLCRTFITASAIAGDSVNFTNTTVGGYPPYQYLWNFGDGTTSNQNSYTHTYKYRGGYPVSLRVVDAHGDTAVANYNVKTKNDVSSCAANYSISSIAQLPLNPALSQIIITWVDANGVVYTSDNSLQPNDSSFEIVSVSDSERNENGQTTKKVTAKFNCRLYNGSSFITVNTAEVVICVAYK